LDDFFSNMFPQSGGNNTGGKRQALWLA
jgi:hypothetical protein